MVHLILKVTWLSPLATWSIGDLLLEVVRAVWTVRDKGQSLRVGSGMKRLFSGTADGIQVGWGHGLLSLGGGVMWDDGV